MNKFTTRKIESRGFRFGITLRDGLIGAVSLNAADSDLWSGDNGPETFRARQDIRRAIRAIGADLCRDTVAIVDCEGVKLDELEMGQD